MVLYNDYIMEVDDNSDVNCGNGVNHANHNY